MKPMNRLIRRLLIAMVLLPVVGLTQAEEGEICSPFMDGKVDASLLATMLSAAHDGKLYRIQPESSQVGFCVGSKLSQITGRFRDFRGGMALPGRNSGNGQTLVLIRADSLETGNTLIENMIKGESFFDTEHYPEVLFVSNGFRWKGADAAVLTGNLTIRGITRPVTFDVTLTPVKTVKSGSTNRILVKATTTINRSDFGMESLDSMVDHDVKLCMTVEAEKYQSISSTGATREALPFDPSS